MTKLKEERFLFLIIDIFLFFRDLYQIFKELNSFGSQCKIAFLASLILVKHTPHTVWVYVYEILRAYYRDTWKFQRRMSHLA